MKEILAVSLFFSKSLLKERATAIFVILAVVMIAIALGLSDINIARRFKLLEDVLLTSQMFLLHIAALFYAFEFLQKERTLGLFVLPLSAGMSRGRYLVSKFITLTIMVMSIFFSFLALDAVILYFIEKEITYMLFWQLFLYVLSALVLGFSILFFSNLVSLMNSVIYAVALFFIGNGLDEFYIYAKHISKDALMQYIASLLFYTVPNYSIFDKQAEVVNRAYISTEQFYLYPVLYFFALLFLIFSASYLKYRTKVLRFGE